MTLEDFVINNLRDSFAIIIFFIGMLFVFLSLKEKYKNYSEKVFALLFLLGISLFANNSICYFAAIFIIAASVIDLEFLQNLAAIIRGSKEYFAYKREQYSPKEKSSQIEKELELNKPKDTRDKNLTEIKPKIIESYVLTEIKALNYLETKFGMSIERNLRFNNKNRQIEVDGISQGTNIDSIFEVKVLFKHELDANIKKRYIENARKILDNYYEITHRHAILNFIIVGSIKPEAKKELFDELYISNSSTQYRISLNFLSFDELGLKLEDNLVTFK